MKRKAGGMAVTDGPAIEKPPHAAPHVRAMKPQSKPGAAVPTTCAYCSMRWPNRADALAHEAGCPSKGR